MGGSDPRCGDVVEGVGCGRGSEAGPEELSEVLQCHCKGTLLGVVPNEVR